MEVSNKAHSVHLSPRLQIDNKDVVFVMYSGGVESTACLIHAFNEGYQPVAVHTVYSNPSLAEDPFAEKIANELNVPYHRLVHSDQLFKHYSSQKIWDAGIWTLDACKIAFLVPNSRRIWFGRNCGVKSIDDSDGDGYQDSDGPDRQYRLVQAVDTFAGMHHSPVRLYSPLAKKTKRQQWDMIPDNIKQLVVTCYQMVDNKPCGTCTKCKEFKLMVNDE